MSVVVVNDEEVVVAACQRERKGKKVETLAL